MIAPFSFTCAERTPPRQRPKGVIISSSNGCSSVSSILNSISRGHSACVHIPVEHHSSYVIRRARTNCHMLHRQGALLITEFAFQNVFLSAANKFPGWPRHRN
jgi:ABC-type phosphate/phosphonate transport system ATPase subunit